MFYYWFAIILAVIGSIFHKKKSGQIISWICLFYMMILSGFRDLSIGTDTIHYYNSFYEEGHATDFVWSFMRLFVQSLNLEYHHFLIIVAALTYSIFAYVIRKMLSPSTIPYAILLFIVAGNQYFIQSFNVMRQILATMVLLLVYFWSHRKKIKLALLTYLIACGIHASSIIYAPFILCAYFIKPSTKIVDWALLSSFIYAFFMSSINVSSLANSAILAIPFLDLEYYAAYLLSDDYSNGFNIIGMITLIPLRCIASSLTYKVLKENLFSKVYFVGAISMSILSPVFYFAPRALMGLIACELIVIPMAMDFNRFRNYSKSRSKFYYHNVFYCLYMLFYGYMLARGLMGDYVLPENLGAYRFY